MFSPVGRALAYRSWGPQVMVVALIPSSIGGETHFARGGCEEVGEAAGLKLSEQDMAAERILATQASLPPPTQDHSRLWEWHPQAVVKSGNSSQGRPRHPPLAPRGWVRRAGQGIIFDFLFAIVSAGINKRLPLPKILNSLVRNSPRR